MDINKERGEKKRTEIIIIIDDVMHQFFSFSIFFYFLIIISLFYYNNYIGFIIITINEINIILKDQFDDNYCNFMPVNLLKKKRILFYKFLYMSLH